MKSTLLIFLFSLLAHVASAEIQIEKSLKAAKELLLTGNIGGAKASCIGILSFDQYNISARRLLWTIDSAIYSKVNRLIFLSDPLCDRAFQVVHVNYHQSAISLEPWKPLPTEDHEAEQDAAANP